MTDTSVTMNVGIEIGIQDKLQSEQKQKDFHFISLLNNLDRSTLVDSEASFGWHKTRANSPPEFQKLRCRLLHGTREQDCKNEKS